MYFTSHNIPALQGLKLQQRMLVVKQALSELPATKKIILNLLKIVILGHFFSIFARYQGWEMLPYLLVGGLLYPLITNPVTYHLVNKQLPAAREKLQLDK